MFSQLLVAVQALAVSSPSDLAQDTDAYSCVVPYVPKLTKLAEQSAAAEVVVLLSFLDWATDGDQTLGRWEPCSLPGTSDGIAGGAWAPGALVRAE